MQVEEVGHLIAHQVEQVEQVVVEQALDQDQEVVERMVLLIQEEEVEELNLKDLHKHQVPADRESLL
jgi:YesN/AraC family two-component response regulator